jgi:hypothetical protein
MNQTLTTHSIWGFAYKHLSGHAMLGIYVLIQLFFNCKSHHHVVHTHRY